MTYIQRNALTVLVLAFGSLQAMEQGDLEKKKQLLYHAVIASEVALARKLVKESPNLVQEPFLGATPLEHAAREGKHALGTFLLEHGASPNASAPRIAAPLHLVTARMVKEFYTLRTPRDEHYFIPPSFDFFSLLLSHGADIKAQDDVGCTIFHAFKCHPAAFVALYKSMINAIFSARIQPYILNHGRDEQGFALAAAGTIADLRTALSLPNSEGKSAIAQECRSKECTHQRKCVGLKKCYMQDLLGKVHGLRDDDNDGFAIFAEQCNAVLIHQSTLAHCQPNLKPPAAEVVNDSKE